MPVFIFASLPNDIESNLNNTPFFCKPTVISFILEPFPILPDLNKPIHFVSPLIRVTISNSLISPISRISSSESISLFASISNNIGVLETNFRSVFKTHFEFSDTAFKNVVATTSTSGKTSPD